MAIGVPFAAKRSKSVVRGRLCLRAERGKTQRSLPVSTRNCIFVRLSVINKRPLELGQSCVAIDDCLWHFPIPAGNHRVSSTSAPCHRICGGKCT